MANIGTFTAEKDGFTGQLRTLTLNVKVKLVPNDKGENESAPDFRLQAAGHDFGAAWKKTSEAGRDYLSVAIDDPSFPATVYARLIEGENEQHGVSARCAAGLSGCAPCRQWRHVHSASIPHAFAPEGAARSACGNPDALGRVALFQHGLELLAHLRQQFIGLARVVTGIGQRQ